MRAELAAALEQLAGVVGQSGFAENSRASASAITGDCSAGFISAQLPVTSAAAVMPVRIASGKFHGAMTRRRRAARRNKRWFHPATVWVSRGAASRSISRA